MKNIVVLFLVHVICLRNSSYAQSIIDYYKSDLCEFFTKGEEKALGINVRMVYPCDWIVSKNVRPGTLVQYSFNLSDSIYISQNINFKKIPTKWDWSIESMKETKKIFEKVNLEKGIKLESFKQVSIDLLKSIEYESSLYAENTIGKKHGYTIQYIIPYKLTSIAITFRVTATSIDNAKRLYDLYLPLFKYLADKTVVLSQWE